jgi:LIVCS family branched-chain amino acid:cation transporter
LSVLVSLACFTTAVGIVTGTADFFKWYFKDSQMAFRITALIGCILGVLMGQFNVAYIIAVAMPALMLIYPVTIVLILLNLLPSRWASTTVFRAVVVTTLLFSLPDLLISLGLLEKESPWLAWLPLAEFGMGWVLPASLALVLFNISAKNIEHD